MSINPGVNYGWNYSKPNKPGYSTTLVGTVLAIQEVQKMTWTPNGNSSAPEFWPDGNPKLNIRMALATEAGELKTFTFQPAGKEARMGRKPSIHMDLFHLTGDTDMANLIGKTISISTQEGMYGQGNPRPWHVQLVEAGPFSLPGQLPAEFKVERLLANTAVSGGQVQQQPQPQQAYQPQPSYQPQAYQPQQPAYQPQQPVYYQQQAAYQQQQVQPAYQQPVVPQGMDPSVAAAMQQMGASNVQEVPQQAPVSGMVYDDDLPF